MFKWKSTERPSTPKLGSVALPDAFSPVFSAIPMKASFSEKPSKSSIFNRFRSTPPVSEKTHRISLSDGARHKAQAASCVLDDDDEVIFKSSKDLDSVFLAKSKISSGTTFPSKSYKEEEMEKREREEERELEEVKRLARKHTNVRISIAKSKAAKEEEMERLEEEEREQEMREMDEMKKAAQRQYSAMQAAPRKSCLKVSTPSATPSPTFHYDLPSAHPRADLRRRDSLATYYSDTEQCRPSYRSNRRSDNYHAQPHRSGSYPPDPVSLSHQGYPDQRSRNQSLTGSRQPGRTTPGHTPKYMKAYIKEVPLKDEAIALSWPLVDFETRKHARCPSLFFDAAFDPRLRGYEIQLMRYGESSRSPMVREEEKLAVSPHAFMTEMILINEKLSQWPVSIHRPSGIRCIDVFRAIYDTYSIVLTKAELMHLGQDRIDRCQRAFEQRCHDGPQLPPVTKARGICRIDLLRGEKIFKGVTPLTGSQYPPNSWQLHFEQITRQRA